jgi:membrane associated rhomboid family serine protease
VIPLKDSLPTARRPVVTFFLIGACVVVYFFVQPIGKVTVLRQSSSMSVQQADIDFTYQHAAIPCELVRDRPLTTGDIRLSCPRTAAGSPIFAHKNVWLAVLYSMFLHASLLHIGGNMLFLWIFGNNVEDRMGHIPYLIFYLVAGAVATGAFVLSSPYSTAPLLGASGAIAGVMGAYLVNFPRSRVRTLILVPPIILWPRIPAWVLLVFWFGSQFFISPNNGVAWVAHVAGFVFGAVVGLAWRSRDRTRAAAPTHR